MITHSRRKSKGLNAERELVHLFWSNGWSAARIAGSGSSSMPSPDIIAGGKGKLLVIECKTVEKLPKYFSSKEIEELEEFAFRMGAKPIVAVKINRKGWYYCDSRMLRKTNNSFVFDESIEKKEIKELFL